MDAQTVVGKIQSLADEKRALVSARFFKTGVGEYGQGDKFIGLTMPQVRQIAKDSKDLPLTQIKILITNEFHEVRMCGWVIVLVQYEKSRDSQLIDFICAHKEYMNNWDLVDVIIPKTLGHYLLDKDRKILYEYAKSTHLWTKRIAILATFAFIRENDLNDTYAIADMLLSDTHDLMHKAVGWMLREAGKRDEARLEKYIRANHKKMARTCLRYAIEKFEETKRKELLSL